MREAYSSISRNGAVVVSRLASGVSLSRATQKRVGRRSSGRATGIFVVDGDGDGGGHESRVS